MQEGRGGSQDMVVNMEIRKWTSKVRNSWKDMKLSGMQWRLHRKDNGGWETKVHREMGDRWKKTDQRVMKDKWRESAMTGGKKDGFQDALVGKNPELSIKFHEESKSVAGWKQLSLVGEVLDMGILSDLKNRLNGLVESGTDLRYIGGMKVMLTFCSTVGASKFLNDRMMDHELISKELAIWEGQDVSFDRIAWVQVHGVPLQLWEANTFDRIGQLLNKVVEFSPTSNKTGNLSFNEIGILVSNPLRISTSMNLEWGGKPYPGEEVLRPRFAQGHLNRQANLRIRAGVLGVRKEVKNKKRISSTSHEQLLGEDRSESHNSGDGDPAPDPNDVGDGGIDSSNIDQIGGNNPSEWESELGAEESRGGKGIKEGQDLPAPNFTQVDLNASPVISVSLDQVRGEADPTRDILELEKRGPGSRNSE
ncbi:hypothetical protein L1987_39450 [Smallanthus sonchifolius]|uniref:Uncharacterized protein n=1 Tax=Smallanthus sonchifolius TaxID=185202 RepID=A0ACB9HND6_9ASTR|nr:hypothetical protein L1987_39450 [Smallanthus sonchifolius]